MSANGLVENTSPFSFILRAESLSSAFVPSAALLMSQTPHSPYTQPVPNSPSGASGSSTNTVIIVAIVSVTMLLMCGGVLGLGYYAVERLAREINAIDYDYMVDDEETPEANRHGLKPKHHPMNDCRYCGLVT